MGMYAAVSARVGVCAGVVGLVTALAAPTIGVPTLRAQQTPGADEVLYDMADSMGMLRTNAETDMFMAVEWWASGSMADVGPDTIGPLVEVESLFAEIGYDFPGMRVDVTRAGERKIQVVSGEFAWNEIDEIGGGLVEGLRERRSYAGGRVRSTPEDVDDSGGRGQGDGCRVGIRRR